MKCIKGLTLIEVLIALAIISIAMTAVIKATGENIRATNHLQNKTIATWVGQNILHEVQVGVLKLPSSSDQLHEKTTMLGADWYWQACLKDTPSPRIKKIEVLVFTEENDNQQASPLSRLEGYLYVSK